MEMSEQKDCTHRYLTSHGRGWECADCGVGVLSLSVPIPLPTIAKALEVIAAGVALPVKAQLEAKADIPEWKAEDVAALDGALAKYPPKAVCEASESEPGVFLCVPCGGQVGAECPSGVETSDKPQQEKRDA
jgi:hypothetical protein